MEHKLGKRASELLRATDQAAAAAPAAGPRAGVPGLMREFARADKASLDRLAELETRYAGGTALPCLKLDPSQIATGRFFNRFPQAFDADKDTEFAALVDDIRAQGGNLVPGMVRPSTDGPLPFELVYGERRLRACALAEVLFEAKVCALSDEEMAVLHTKENSHREDSSAVESALQLRSWLLLLAGSMDRVTGELAERVGTRLGYKRRHVFTLRRIAEIPLDVLERIPGIRMISVRQAMMLVKAWDDDHEGLEERLRQLATMPARVPKEVIAFLVGPAPFSGKDLGSRKVTIRWPSDPEVAKILRARLQSLEKEFGVRLGLPRK